MYEHLQKRTHFCDFLLLTGIFEDPNLNRQHQGVYNRILNHYLERYEELDRLRQLGVDPDQETRHSETDQNDEVRC